VTPAERHRVTSMLVSIDPDDLSPDPPDGSHDYAAGG
jgi:hypothetical protein